MRNAAFTPFTASGGWGLDLSALGLKTKPRSRSQAPVPTGPNSFFIAEVETGEGSMGSPVVMVLEDHELTRLTLKHDLEVRGFTVYAVATVREARELTARHGKEFEVAVLDMRLEDKEFTGLTGADVGMEILKQAVRPPEFVIYSAFARVDYYRQALRLGAAVYLEKNKNETSDVVRYVRALILRRSFNLRNPVILEMIQQIADSSQSHTQAVARFCSEVLRVELARVLRVPFALLLTETRDGAVLYAGSSLNLPGQASQLYRDLQSLIFLPGDNEPLMILPEQLCSAGVHDENGLLERMRNAAFIPLAETEEIRLSLGILQEDVEANPLADKADKLASVMAQVFRSTLLDHLFSLTARWAEANVKRKEILTATAKFCLHVGQEYVAILDEATRSGEFPPGEKPAYVRRLQALGEDLRDAGEVLEDLNEEAPHRVEIQGAEQVYKVWRHLARQQDLQAADVFTLEGDCLAYVNPADFYIAISQILRWFLQRTPDRPAHQAPSVRVCLGQDDDKAEIWFQDSSYRIPTKLREHLFEPFAGGDSARGGSASEELRGRRLGLYLAKMVIETRNRGSVEDRSHQLEGDLGHLLLLRLPAASATGKRA
jgi:signal transduction histidine kinase